jgi:hypothetical protein
MSKIHCFVFFLIAPFFLFSQTYHDTHDPKSSDVKSLLGKENELAGFGGADVKLSTIKDDRTLLLGMHGGFVINRHFLFGLSACGMTTKNSFSGTHPGQTTTKQLNIEGGYGGLLFGATLFTKEVIHVTFPIVFGAGYLDVVDPNFLGAFSNQEVTVEQSAFVVVEPAVQLEINITKNLRLAAGASYRYVTASSLQNIVNSDLTGFASSVSVRFGRF